MLQPVDELTWKVVVDRSSVAKWFLITFFLGTAFTLCVTKALDKLSTALAVLVSVMIAMGVYLFFTAVEKFIMRCFNVEIDSGASMISKGPVEVTSSTPGSKTRAMDPMRVQMDLVLENLKLVTDGVVSLQRQQEQSAAAAAQAAKQAIVPLPPLSPSVQATGDHHTQGRGSDSRHAKAQKSKRAKPIAYTSIQAPAM
jgi:hypothetical protein